MCFYSFVLCPNFYDADDDDDGAVVDQDIVDVVDDAVVDDDVVDVDGVDDDDGGDDDYQGNGVMIML